MNPTVTTPKPLVLILCTGNSCRSQMAEGILRHLAGDLLEVASAGSKPAGWVHPAAIQVCSEIGVDLSSARSKSWDEFFLHDVDTVITVCGNADSACPVFPGQCLRHHWAFDDPASATGSSEEIAATFRLCRDQIFKVLQAYTAGLRRGLQGNPGSKE